MSDQELNLKVVADHLGELAAVQLQAANQITGANRVAADIASKIEGTHGLICWATTLVMKNGEAARDAAGKKAHDVSTEFNAKLTTAATNYADRDYREGRSIGEACQA